MEAFPGAASVPSSGVSADMLFSKDKEIMDRADALLARGSASQKATTCIVDSKSSRNSSVQIALTQRQRRALVHKHLHYKFSTMTSQAAIIKTHARPVVVARFTEASDLLPIDKASKYSGWCPVCRERKEWCGFAHESMGRNKVQKSPSTSEKTNSTAMWGIKWAPNLADYEAKVKAKARRRRGNAVRDAWHSLATRRLHVQEFNRKRIQRNQSTKVERK
jgi:hypothetical protein